MLDLKPSINPEMLFWEGGCYSIGFFLGGLLVDLRHAARGERLKSAAAFHCVPLSGLLGQ